MAPEHKVVAVGGEACAAAAGAPHGGREVGPSRGAGAAGTHPGKAASVPQKAELGDGGACGRQPAVLDLQDTEAHVIGDKEPRLGDGEEVAAGAEHAGGGDCELDQLEDPLGPERGEGVAACARGTTQ